MILNGWERGRREIRDSSPPNIDPAIAPTTDRDKRSGLPVGTSSTLWLRNTVSDFYMASQSCWNIRWLWNISARLSCKKRFQYLNKWGSAHSREHIRGSMSVSRFSAFSKIWFNGSGSKWGTWGKGRKVRSVFTALTSTIGGSGVKAAPEIEWVPLTIPGLPSFLWKS